MEIQTPRSDTRVGPTGKPTLGVLGGMGPLATADFLSKVATRTPAQRDQDHLPVIMFSDPTTPDRSDALLGGGDSPLPAMLAGIDFLNRAGCSIVAMPCNTAHYWYDPISEASLAPVVHIVDALIEQLDLLDTRTATIGLMATSGTIQSGIYNRIADTGRSILDLTELGQQDPVMSGIRAVKAGRVDDARELFAEAARELRSRGAEGLVLGCTDVSGVVDYREPLQGLPVWDAADALAIACVTRLTTRPAHTDLG